MWKSHVERSGLYGGCLKCLPAKSLKLIPHQILSMGTGVILQKYDSVRQNYKAFWLYGAPQHPQPPRNEPHLSALLWLPPFPMLDEYSLHDAHTTVWNCDFSLRMSPTLQMAVLIRNNSVASFCEECVLWQVFVFIWISLIKLQFIIGALENIKYSKTYRFCMEWNLRILGNCCFRYLSTAMYYSYGQRSSPSVGRWSWAARQVT